MAKWIPGDYVVYSLEFAFADGFTGGEIQLYSITSCGADTRSWVNRCSGCHIDTVTKIGVYNVDQNHGNVVEAVIEKKVKEISYYNMMGQQIDDINGLTIVVTVYTDGTTAVKKIIR